MDSKENIETISPQRIEWIDILKGLGIYLVFLGHVLATSYKSVTIYIYSFHMPLFFFVSGMFFKYSDVNSSFYKFIKKKFRSLMVPYVLFGILTYCIWLLQMMLKKYRIIGSYPVPESLIRPLIGMIYGNGIDGWLKHNVLLWFLPCLMITEILFYCIVASAKNNTLTISLLLIFFAIVGHADSLCSPIRLPFGIDVAFTAVVFYGSGYILKDKLLLSETTILFSAICFSIGLFTGHLNGRVDMNENHYNNIAIFYIAAFSSIYAYMYISKCFLKIRFLKCITYIGRNSLVFFLLEDTAFLAVQILMHFTIGIKVSPNNVTFLYGSAYILLSMLLIVPVTYIINHHAPFMIGK